MLGLSIRQLALSNGAESYTLLPHRRALIGRPRHELNQNPVITICKAKPDAVEPFVYNARCLRSVLSSLYFILSFTLPLQVLYCPKSLAQPGPGGKFPRASTAAARRGRRGETKPHWAGRLELCDFLDVRQ